MKKALLTLILALATLASAWAGKPSQLIRLARQYKGVDGFEMLFLGPMGTALLKGTVSLSGNLDKEDRAALKAFTDIRRFTLIDFEDIPADKKASFTAKVERILKGMDLILEAKDDGEILRIYGIDKGKRLKDCILYSSDGTLLVTSGSIGLEQLGQLMEVAE